MGKGKSSVPNAALLTALLLSYPTIALADKGGKGPGHPWNPNANLGLGAIPKVGVGLPAAGPMTIPPRTVFAVPATLSASAAPRSGGGVPAQVTAPGAGRSASSAGVTPPGLSNPPGIRSGQGHGNGYANGQGNAHANAQESGNAHDLGNAYGHGNAIDQDRSNPGKDTVPLGLAGDRGSEAARPTAQAGSQEGGALPNTPPLTETPQAPERLASAQSPSSETTENLAGPLPTCR